MYPIIYNDDNENNALEWVGDLAVYTAAYGAAAYPSVILRLVTPPP